MNIAFAVVKHIARGGGIEKYTEELGTRLVERGHQVRVYSMRHYGPVTQEYRGMEIVTVPSLFLPQGQKISAGLYSSIHASLDRWADVIHLQHVCPGAMAWFTRMCRKPSVIQYHGLEWKRSRWGSFGAAVLKGLERWSVLVNTHFTAVSAQQCQYFRDTYNINVSYIPTGAEIKPHVDAQEITALGLHPQRYILFAARLVRDKGAHYLIPAFRRLMTDYTLVIAGDTSGNNEYKQELLDLAGDDPRILFPGYVEGRLLHELFSNALMYVLPSEIEGLSIALLEAMSYGLCCLVSDIPENLEALGGCGFTFQNRNIDDLSRQLQHIMANPQATNQYARHAVARVAEHYSWDRVTDQFEQLYQEIALPARSRAQAEAARKKVEI
ncbi:MAG TPA: glycosyltransferase family 4 protein [Armatimonadota bacterium]|jgi:glycosyltransferase involved in cell wall biosynthesis